MLSRWASSSPGCSILKETSKRRHLIVEHELILSSRWPTLLFLDIPRWTSPDQWGLGATERWFRNHHQGFPSSGSLQGWDASSTGRFAIGMGSLSFALPRLVSGPELPIFAVTQRETHRINFMEIMSEHTRSLPFVTSHPREVFYTSRIPYSISTNIHFKA